MISVGCMFLAVLCHMMTSFVKNCEDVLSYNFEVQRVFWMLSFSFLWTRSHVWFQLQR